MSESSITCVIPTHARDDLLAIALASVAVQTYPPDAVVVVDDVGSPDTDRLVRSYGERFSYLNASGGGNPGASSSRNVGASRAASTHLAFLDDDDRWEPAFLAECLAEMERSGTSLVAAWGSREVNGKVYPKSLSVEPGVTSNQALAHNPGVTGSNFLISRSVFDELGGFDTGLPVYNDLDFFVRFLQAGHTYGVVAKPLVIQTADGAGHLSSRGASRAAGIQKYIAKHRTEATRSQLRRLRRDFHLAQRYKGQQLARSGAHFVLMWANSSPRQLVRVIREKSTRRAKIYA
ncbi:glycosyltransferase family 2 protein [Arthrobacter sp. TB 23]|uniref:glycosyltransferase family 2 protein n=1 Tax=Arthrobacter sp. TB 23 TaxID=494419 RepID=UPI0003817790|nr:glycosyltransferase [Arthrobacter sp. TB 23]